MIAHVNKRRHSMTCTKLVNELFKIIALKRGAPDDVGYYEDNTSLSRVSHVHPPSKDARDRCYDKYLLKTNSCSNNPVVEAIDAEPQLFDYAATACNTEH